MKSFALTIFQVLDPSLDSPSGIFYVNISHTASSQYDAYDVNITDIIEGMNVIRKNEFPGIEISAPADNVYKFSAKIPVISGTITFGNISHDIYPIAQTNKSSWRALLHVVRALLTTFSCLVQYATISSCERQFAV